MSIILLLIFNAYGGHISEASSDMMMCECKGVERLIVLNLNLHHFYIIHSYYVVQKSKYSDI